MAENAANARRGTYTATWNSIDLGGTRKVTLDAKAIVRPIVIESAGVFPLDARFEGLDMATLTVELAEPTKARIRTLSPWANQTANAIVEGTPAVGASLKALAQALVLHPTDVADTRQDVTIWRACPHPEDVVLRDRDPANYETWAVRFLIFPDLTKASNLYWFQIGAGTD